VVDPTWVALSLSRHIGGKTLKNLLDYFQHDPNAILSADEKSLRKVNGIGAKIAQTIRELDVDATAEAMHRWGDAGVQICTWDDPAYPAILKTLDDPPPTIFMRGSNEMDWTNAVAIVGTRKPTQQARHIALRLGKHLAEQGHLIVSGLAIGMDTAGHHGALAAPDGRTAAVLGSGTLNIYPLENAQLAEQIMKRGVILSEVHPYVTANASRLVARNRLISGLCSAIIVVETAVDGGAMYAAKFAQQQGRTVYTVDLPASGNQHLIQNGAEIISPAFSSLEF